MFMLMGGNHNYFNTRWTPSADNIWGFDDGNKQISSLDMFCDLTGSRSGFLTDAEQRVAASAYVSGFFRQYLLNENITDVLTNENSLPSSALDADVRVSYQLPSIHRLDINRLDKPERMIMNNLGGQALSNRIYNYGICSDTLANQYCYPTFTYQLNQLLNLQSFGLKYIR